MASSGTNAIMKALRGINIPLSEAKYTTRYQGYSNNTYIQSKLSQLKHEGYCVMDNVFDSTFVSNLRSEITYAKEVQAMDVNHTHLVLPTGKQQEQTKLFPKHNIYELDCLLKPNFVTEDSLRNCHYLNSDQTLKKMIHTYLPELGLLNGISPLKLQYNDGNYGCFPCHTDASLIVGKQASETFNSFSPTSADNRVITAIIYMNDYKPKQGGELRLYPILQNPVDIAPVAGRVVLFSSTTMLHRVLPSTTTPRGDKRVCATIWFHGDNSYGGVINRRADMTPKPLPENANSVETALFLLQPYYRPFTCRMLYADVSSWAPLKINPTAL